MLLCRPSECIVKRVRGRVPPRKRPSWVLTKAVKGGDNRNAVVAGIHRLRFSLNKDGRPAVPDWLMSSNRGLNMRRLRFLATAFAALLVHTGCASISNVVYTADQRKASSSSIFMDRSGDLYPPVAVHVDPDRMSGKIDGCDDYPTDGEFTLRAYFFREEQGNTSNWTDLLSATNVVASDDFCRDWSEVQSRLRKAIVADINKSTEKEVLLVVHGYNNDYNKANKWIDGFNDAVVELRPGVRVVKLYWDGLIGPDYGIGPWGEAQFNGPRVGQGLRQILNQLNPDLRLRIFTHSSGAYVITNALGNGGGSYNGFSGNRNRVVRERAGALDGDHAIPTNLADLRVAMLIPAQPLSAFNFYRDETGQNATYQGVIPNRLILGTSKRDSAASKRILSCRWFGDTCMAVKPKSACETVRKELDGNASSVVVIDFPKPANSRYHDHGVGSYMKDSEQWSELMSQLFDDQPRIVQEKISCSSM